VKPVQEGGPRSPRAGLVRTGGWTNSAPEAPQDLRGGLRIKNGKFTVRSFLPGTPRSWEIGEGHKATSGRLQRMLISREIRARHRLTGWCARQLNGETGALPLRPDSKVSSRVRLAVRGPPIVADRVRPSQGRSTRWARHDMMLIGVGGSWRRGPTTGAAALGGRGRRAITPRTRLVLRSTGGISSGRPSTHCSWKRRYQRLQGGRGRNFRGRPDPRSTLDGATGPLDDECIVGTDPVWHGRPGCVAGCFGADCIIGRPPTRILGRRRSGFRSEDGAGHRLVRGGA